MNRLAAHAADLAGDALLFVIAFLVSTGLTCGGPTPVTCDYGRPATQVQTP